MVCNTLRIAWRAFFSDSLYSVRFVVALRLVVVVINQLVSLYETMKHLTGIEDSTAIS